MNSTVHINQLSSTNQNSPNHVRCSESITVLSRPVRAENNRVPSPRIALLCSCLHATGTGGEHAVVSRGGWTGVGSTNDDSSNISSSNSSSKKRSTWPLPSLPSSGWAMEGAWAWRWKVKIDKKWMAGYQELSSMSSTQSSDPSSSGQITGVPAVYSTAGAAAVAALGATDMRCGGCGSKVS